MDWPLTVPINYSSNLKIFENSRLKAKNLKKILNCSNNVFSKYVRTISETKYRLYKSTSAFLNFVCGSRPPAFKIDFPWRFLGGVGQSSNSVVVVASTWNQANKSCSLISNECQLSTESNVWSGSTNLKVCKLKMNINDKISFFAISFALN